MEQLSLNDAAEREGKKKKNEEKTRRKRRRRRRNRIAVPYSIRSSYPGLYLLYCVYRLRIREREIQLYVNYTTDKYVLSDIIISTCQYD